MVLINCLLIQINLSNFLTEPYFHKHVSQKKVDRNSIFFSFFFFCTINDNTKCPQSQELNFYVFLQTSIAAQSLASSNLLKVRCCWSELRYSSFLYKSSMRAPILMFSIYEFSLHSIQMILWQASCKFPPLLSATWKLDQDWLLCCQSSLMPLNWFSRLSSIFRFHPFSCRPFWRGRLHTVFAWRGVTRCRFHTAIRRFIVSYN